MSSLLRPSTGKEKREAFKKPTSGLEEARRKREDEAMRIRRITRIEALQKKRNVGGVDQSWDGAQGGNEPLMDSTEHSSAKVRARQLCPNGLGCASACADARRPRPRAQSLASLPAMVQGVWTEDPMMQLESTKQFRKLLSIGVCPGRRRAPRAQPHGSLPAAPHAPGPLPPRRTR